MHSCLVMSDSLQPLGLYFTRLLCPWNFPGKNTVLGCYFLLQRIFPAQGLNPHLLHLLYWQGDSSPLHFWGSPMEVLDNTMVIIILQYISVEKEMATHANIIAWRIPWTEEPGSLQSMGLQSVGHN